MSGVVIIFIIACFFIVFFTLFFSLLFYFTKKAPEYYKKNKDKINGFTYRLSPKEAKYLWFSDKNCPNCGAKMKEKKEYELRDWSSEWHPSAGIDVDIHPYGKVKYCIYKFHCPACNSEYLLSELATMKRKATKAL